MRASFLLTAFPEKGETYRHCGGVIRPAHLAPNPFLSSLSEVLQSITHRRAGDLDHPVERRIQVQN